MSFFTTITRMWLTKTFKPFTFTDKYEESLTYKNCNNLGLYVHIPFCKNICTFCPYCKVVYDESSCNKYIDTLLKEISIVGKMESGKKLATSLYFGGGSPALVSTRINEIIEEIQKYFTITEGIGVELHPSDVTVETLTLLKNTGVTKISIGIQSFNEKFLSILGRSDFDIDVMKKALAQVSFETVSMDFIFELPSQTFEDLKEDIETAFALGGNHFAIYPFIDFAFTKSNINPMTKKEKRKKDK